ncbi:MAG: adhesin [Balneolaceae bacterium]|nr:adhesin [Balneolaceae bacterium]
MALRNRKTLKNYFQKGELPKQGHFEDFIDSVVNIIDDGISVSLKDGLKITPLGEMGSLISFYRDVQDELPQWSIVLDKSNNVLSLNNYDKEKVISFTSDGNVGIGVEEARHKLDVDGVVGMKGRIGNYRDKEEEPKSVHRVRADGNWHPILTGLDGSHAYEIMAGVGKKKTGKYALLHATAISTYGGWSRSKIRKTQARYRWFWHKILLRWKGGTYDYALEMRTMSDYGEGIYINYNITRLWFDEYMRDSQLADNSDQNLLEGDDG